MGFTLRAAVPELQRLFLAPDFVKVISPHLQRVQIRLIGHICLVGNFAKLLILMADALELVQTLLYLRGRS